MKRFILLILAVSLLPACNTVAGFGKDLKKVGNSIERGASK